MYCAVNYSIREVLYVPSLLSSKRGCTNAACFTAVVLSIDLVQVEYTNSILKVYCARRGKPYAASQKGVAL